MSSPAELPDIAEALAGLLQRVPPTERPLLVALAERLAAERYRAWAREVTKPADSAALLACAEREEEIARRVEALSPESASMQRDLVARNPDLLEINQSLFAPYSLDQQLVLQSRGERLGAATWRSFARHEQSVERRDVFLSCALLEEESATVLESLAPRGGTESR